MATKEDQETLRLLVQHVSRAFYEPKFTIIMDQLARHPVLKDDDLAGRMGLQPKELNKVIAVLNNDCLVKVYRQNELKEGAQRSVGKQYYYIDYQHFCNVVKWRVAKMRHIIDSSLRNELDNRGYVCTQCKQSYTPLEVDKLMDFMRGIMVCEICHAEVVDNENTESVQGSKDRMQRFNHQMRFIREGLQKSEAMVLPAFDVATWVKTHATESDKQKSSQLHGGLKTAGSDSNKKVDEGVVIMMAMDKDEATRRQERAAEAELKRQQNALPAWHLKSTITGDLTSLGIKESARAEAAAAANGTGTSSNDDILKGLGVVHRHVDQQQPNHQNMLSFSHHVEDEKPKIRNDDGDYYDQYYASLAASTNVSAHPTPTPTTLTGRSHSSDVGDYFNDDDEDRKPNVEYLDSLNAYRKRSRSDEDEGVKATKALKLSPGGSHNEMTNGINGIANGVNGYHTNGVSSVNGNGVVNVVENGYGYGYDDVPMVNGFGAADATNGASVEDDPIVYVNGSPVPFSKVTEEDQDLMTPDEYTAYFDIMQGT